jgi:hypothetical protein
MCTEINWLSLTGFWFLSMCDIQNIVHPGEFADIKKVLALLLEIRVNLNAVSMKGLFPCMTILFSFLPLC